MNVAEQQADGAAGAGTHAQCALEHAHHDTRPDAVSRHISHVAEPPSVLFDDVHEITADVAARVRPAEKLEVADTLLDRRHEDTMNIAREVDLGRART